MINVIPQTGTLTGILARQGLVMLFFCFNLATAPAAAQQPEAPRTLIGALQNACAADYRQFCDDIPAGDEAVLACFADHRVVLSESCRIALGPPVSRPPTGPPTTPLPANSTEAHTSRFTTLSALS